MSNCSFTHSSSSWRFSFWELYDMNPQLTHNSAFTAIIQLTLALCFRVCTGNWIISHKICIQLFTTYFLRSCCINSSRCIPLSYLPIFFTMVCMTFWPSAGYGRSQPVPNPNSFQQSTMRCRYNAVNFLHNSHSRHPISLPWGRCMGVFCELEVWFMFYCCDYNIV